MDVKIFYQPVDSTETRDRRLSVENLEVQVKEWLENQQKSDRSVRISSMEQTMTNREIVLTIFYSIPPPDVSKM